MCSPCQTATPHGATPLMSAWNGPPFDIRQPYCGSHWRTAYATDGSVAWPDDLLLCCVAVERSAACVNVTTTFTVWWPRAFPQPRQWVWEGPQAGPCLWRRATCIANCTCGAVVLPPPTALLTHLFLGCCASYRPRRTVGGRDMVGGYGTWLRDLAPPCALRRNSGVRWISLLVFGTNSSEPVVLCRPHTGNPLGTNHAGHVKS